MVFHGNRSLPSLLAANNTEAAYSDYADSVTPACIFLFILACSISRVLGPVGKGGDQNGRAFGYEVDPAPPYVYLPEMTILHLLGSLQHGAHAFTKM